MATVFQYCAQLDNTFWRARRDTDRANRSNPPSASDLRSIALQRPCMALGQRPEVRRPLGEDPPAPPHGGRLRCPSGSRPSVRRRTLPAPAPDRLLVPLTTALAVECSFHPAPPILRWSQGPSGRPVLGKLLGPCLSLSDEFPE